MARFKKFLTKARIEADVPLKADGRELTIPELSDRIKEVSGKPVLDPDSLQKGQSYEEAKQVGRILSAIVTLRGELWLIYTVDLDLLVLPETEEMLLTGKAAAFPSFEYSPETSYGNLMDALIFEAEPQKHRREAEFFHIEIPDGANLFALESVVRNEQWTQLSIMNLK